MLLTSNVMQYPTNQQRLPHSTVSSNQIGARTRSTRQPHEQPSNLHLTTHKLVLALKRIVVFKGKFGDKDLQIPLGGGILEEAVVANGVVSCSVFHLKGRSIVSIQHWC